MKKLIYLVLILPLFFSCAQKQDKVERYTEDGVEVVINHMEPYKIKGELSTFTLEEEFVIDTEKDDIAELGLSDIKSFDVDSKGNIYFLKIRGGEGDNIFKFDGNGNYSASFGSAGQGPGEFQYPSHLEIDNLDNIVVTDQVTRKLVIFNKDGSLIEEIDLTPLDLRIAIVSCLENGNFLIFGQLIGSMRNEYIQLPLRLINSQFEDVKELERYRYMNSVVTQRRRGTAPIWCWSESKGFVYTGNEDRRYEIWKYNLKGNLIRRIKKEYKRVPVSEEYKKELMEGLPESLKRITFFAEFFPPYQSFITDNIGRLFVMTYEEGENPGEFMFDIFNHDGIFVGRKSLDVWIRAGHFQSKIIGNLFYCLHEKESGYKKLVVCKIKWE